MRAVELARSSSDSEDEVSEGPCCETGGFLDPARDGGLVLAREEGARAVDLPREEAGAADSAVEKNGHGVPSFFSRLRCSSLYGRSGGGHRSELSKSIQWFIFCIPPTE